MSATHRAYERKGQDMKTCEKCGMKLYDGETCHCMETAAEADAVDRFRMLRGLHDVVAVILVLGTVAIGIGGVIALSAGEMITGLALLLGAVIFCLNLCLTLAVIVWLREVGTDIRRAADALEATGKIVAEQDAEWRKKGADPNKAEGVP